MFVRPFQLTYNAAQQTVSRAINNKGDISTQTKDYIFKIIDVDLAHRLKSDLSFPSLL